jgi:nucleotidyltransferase substrate binding protein (TIGR01987 family)
MEELNEGLRHKYDNFKKCYEALGKVIHLQDELIMSTISNPVMQDLINAGVIKHFEIAYETAWKFLKEYLSQTYNCEIPSSPKAIFRECDKYQIFPQIMVNELITLADARNTTTHIYNQILAREVCNSIVDHYKVFGQILQIIKID